MTFKGSLSNSNKFYLMPYKLLDSSPKNVTVELPNLHNRTRTDPKLYRTKPRSIRVRFGFEFGFGLGLVRSKIEFNLFRLSRDTNSEFPKYVK